MLIKSYGNDCSSCLLSVIHYDFRLRPVLWVETNFPIDSYFPVNCIMLLRVMSVDSVTVEHLNNYDG